MIHENYCFYDILTCFKNKENKLSQQNLNGIRKIIYDKKFE